MSYTDGQIDRLRLRLCAYRAQKGANGRMRPWKAVLDDILLSDVTEHHYPEDGEFPDFKEEALRRFAAGKSIPSQDKLEDIYAFLVDQNFLSNEELTSGVWDYAVALSLRNLFGEASRGGDYWENLKGDYRAEIDVKYNVLKGHARYDMTVDPVSDETMLKLDMEWFTWLYDQLPEPEFKRKYGDQIRSQRGYGFPSDSHELTLFFKDGLTGKTDIYLVTDMESGSSVSWFKAAKINNDIRFSNEKPKQDLEALTLDKMLYRARKETDGGVQKQGGGHSHGH